MYVVQGNLEEHPLRLFKCVVAECLEAKKDAPIILDHLCQACNNHFKAVLELVEDNGVLYEPDPFFVRERNITVAQCLRSIVVNMNTRSRVGDAMIIFGDVVQK